MKVFGVCVGCGTEADIITKDGRCGPCRYKDSLLTKKHVFEIVETKVIVQEISMSYEEIMTAIKNEYEKIIPSEVRIGELFAMKRAIFAREHDEQRFYDVTDPFKRKA